jgi:hypothetical protein
MGRLALLVSMLLLAAPAAAIAGQHRQAALPIRGVFVTGQSLAGVALGDTPADVEATWGTDYTVCRSCTLTTWYFVYRTQPVGAAVVFDRNDKAVAVFTLGMPLGWRTEKGLLLGQEIHSLTALYPTTEMSLRHCIGYNALSLRHGPSVASIYTQADFVYGFALTMPGRPVCM